MLCVMRRSAVSLSRALRMRSSTCACTVTSSAVVGSSAITRRGRVISTDAIITRCCMPPERRKGYSRRQRSGSGMPQRASHSAARARPSFRETGRCSRSASSSWSPMRCSGESAVIGSWKTIPTAAPRILRSSRSGSVARSRPLKRMRPETSRPGGEGTSRRTDIAVTDLPQPDSPTSPSVSPGASESETPSTARNSPNEVSKETRRSSIRSAASPSPRSRTCVLGKGAASLALAATAGATVGSREESSAEDRGSSPSCRLTRGSRRPASRTSRSSALTGLGSNASRRASPTKTPRSITTKRASEGQRTSHHAWRKACACCSSSPQDGAPSGRPKPR